MSEQDRPGDPADPHAGPMPPGPPAPPVPPVPESSVPPAADWRQTAANPQPAYQPTQYQPTQYQPTQPYGAYTATPRSSSNAVIALVLAILSWLMCPLVLALIALPFAAKGKREIEDSQGWVTGDGMVTAAKVLAWINIAITLCVLAAVVIIMIVMAVSTTR